MAGQILAWHDLRWTLVGGVCWVITPLLSRMWGGDRRRMSRGLRYLTLNELLKSGLVASSSSSRVPHTSGAELNTEYRPTFTITPVVLHQTEPHTSTSRSFHSSNRLPVFSSLIGFRHRSRNDSRIIFSLHSHRVQSTTNQLHSSICKRKTKGNPTFSI